MEHNSSPVNGINGTNGHRFKLRDEVPVLIAGGGPSGLLQAYLLAQLGVKSLIVERYLERLAAPKAHALSPRSLEICRQFGLDVNYIRSIGSQRCDAYWVNFVTSLDGEHVGRLAYERMDTGVLDDTPEMIHNIPQPEFEQIIATELSKTNLVEIRKNVSFVSCLQKDDEVITTVEDRSSGTFYKIQSRYLIACDGAKSKVRQHLGIQCEGEDSYETMMTIHFHADLRPIVGTNVGILHWIMDPEVSGFIIGYDLGGNQVLICNFDSQKNPASSWNEETCLRVLHAALGANAEIKLRSWRPWILSRKVAEQYRTNNVFLAGDAAHSFPPTGGLGLNSGLADVHNLAYRISANLQGWGGSSLLDSYETDRRHVAEVNSRQSVKNGKKIFGLLKALGTTEKDVTLARKNLHDHLRDVEKKKKIDLEISEQQEHFDNLELHIGYVYGSTKYPSNASNYSPKYVQGARLPHAWILPLQTQLFAGIVPADLSYVSEFSQIEIQARKYSTLDLCAKDVFTLIQGSSQHCNDRATIAMELLQQKLAKKRKSGCMASRQKSVLRAVTLGKDFEMIPHSNGDSFCTNLGLTEDMDGGVLVRPDQHILLRVETGCTAEVIVESILRHLFG